MTIGEKSFDEAPALRFPDGSTVCARPPVPWRCSREPGHDGPCAATRDPNIGKKPNHISCDSYTDFRPGFGLYKEQREAIDVWISDHDATKHIKPGETHRYADAIGGSYTYEFTGTSLGTVVTVRCACGERIDVSDYDDW